MRALGPRRREALIAQSSLHGVARALDSGTTVPGLPGWEPVSTPGHTPGHLSFFRASDHVLITGDAIVTLRLNSLTGLVTQQQGLSEPPRYTSWSWPAAKESVTKLAALEPTVLAGGHGRPLTGAETTGALNAFAEYFTGHATTGG